MITVLLYEIGFAMCTNAKGVEETIAERGIPLATFECNSAQDLANATYEMGTDRAHHDRVSAGIWEATVTGIPYTTEPI
jgi:hypothetical protein